MTDRTVLQDYLEGKPANIQALGKRIEALSPGTLEKWILAGFNFTCESPLSKQRTLINGFLRKTILDGSKKKLYIHVDIYCFDKLELPTIAEENIHLGLQSKATFRDLFGNDLEVTLRTSLGPEFDPEFIEDYFDNLWVKMGCSYFEDD